MTCLDGLIDRIMGAESNGNAMAENPNSTATGEAQFTEGTWLDPVKAQQPDLLKADPPPRFWHCGST